MQTSPSLLPGWLAAEQQPFTGWDFSWLGDKWIDEEPPWSYLDMVRELMGHSTAVLDLGTGGGEKLFSLRDAFPPRVAATESYPPNLLLARQRLGPLGVEVVESEDSLNQVLPFDDGQFDLVIDRHTGYNTRDVERVLKPDGIFLTQQVDGNSCRDLIEAFGNQPHWPYFNLAFALERIQETHLQVELAQEWSGWMIFKDISAMVYYLKAIPWMCEGFTVQTHLPYLLKQQERLEREGQLAFKKKLLILKARK
jgi:SAM-dependent methyltransferase